MPSDHIRVVRQAGLLTDQVERFCAINAEAFPPSERKPCSTLLEEIAVGRRLLFTATHDGSLVGFALLAPNVAPDIHLLEFLAVDRAWRGNSVGTRLLEFIVRELRAAASGILVEVESDEAGSPEEQAIRRMRIQFYCRNEARVLDCPFAYSAPNQAGGENVNMKLMWLGLRDDAAPTVRRLLECVAGIYTKSYCLPDDSPLFQAAHSAFDNTAHNSLNDAR